MDARLPCFPYRVRLRSPSFRIREIDIARALDKRFRCQTLTQSYCSRQEFRGCCSLSGRASLAMRRRDAGLLPESPGKSVHTGCVGELWARHCHQLGIAKLPSGTRHSIRRIRFQLTQRLSCLGTLMSAWTASNRTSSLAGVRHQFLFGALVMLLQVVGDRTRSSSCFDGGWRPGHR